jgi:hypothetical protein
MWFKNFINRNKKLIIIISLIFIFLYTTIKNIPTSLLTLLVNKYSQHKISIYNNIGTFWHGKGLIVVTDEKNKVLAPLVLVNWDITFNFTKYININFKVGNDNILNVYLDKSGINLSNLNLSLSISQVSEIFSLIKNLGLSGNLVLKSNKINFINNKLNGIFEVSLNYLSSAISPVNPLGSYKVLIDLEKNIIKVSTNNDSVLKVYGEGNFNSLVLNSKVEEIKKEKMLQFMTMMGIPKSDGSYELKIF